MTVVPDDFTNATFVYQHTSLSRQSTFSIGIDPRSMADPLDPGQQATEIYAAFTSPGAPAVADVMASGWTFVGVSCSLGTVAGPLVGQFLDPVVGTWAVGALPPNCALLVRKNTALGGRRNRGRFFMPPVNVSETGVDGGGFLTSGAQADLASEILAFRTEFETGGGEFVLFHETAPFTPVSITNFAIQNKIATQRRRLRS